MPECISTVPTPRPCSVGTTGCEVTHTLVERAAYLYTLSPYKAELGFNGVYPVPERDIPILTDEGCMEVSKLSKVPMHMVRKDFPSLETKQKEAEIDLSMGINRVIGQFEAETGRKVKDMGLTMENSPASSHLPFRISRVSVYLHPEEK